METIANRIGNLMSCYASYSREADKVFEVAEEQKADVRHLRDLYARWINEELEALAELGIIVEGFDYLKP
jgi:predicted transcriptional regulator